MLTRDPELLRQSELSVAEVPLPVGRLPPVRGAAPDLRNGVSGHPSTCTGISSPSQSRTVAATSTDSVGSCTTSPRVALAASVGSLHDERDMEAFVPITTFLDQPMVAAHLAVVARQYDKSVRRQALAVQEAEQTAQMVVHLFLSAVIGSPELAAFTFFVGCGRTAGTRRAKN